MIGDHVDNTQPQTDGMILTLTLVVSLDDVVQQLQSHSDEQNALNALKALGELGTRGGAAAIDAVTECIERCSRKLGSESVSEVALKVLEHVTEHEDEHALPATSRLLRSHHSIRVRHIVILGLVKIAAKGDDHAIGLLLERLLLERTCSTGNKKGRSSQLCNLRRAVVRALGHLAQKNDKLIIVLLSRYREHRYLRGAATEALEKIMVEGDENAIIEEISPLMHPDVGIRMEEAAALIQRKQTLDKHVIAYSRDDIMLLCRLLHWRHGWHCTPPACPKNSRTSQANSGVLREPHQALRGSGWRPQKPSKTIIRRSQSLSQLLTASISKF
jgi:hypothetical protein